MRFEKNAKETRSYIISFEEERAGFHSGYYSGGPGEIIFRPPDGM